MTFREVMPAQICRVLPIQPQQSIQSRNVLREEGDVTTPLFSQLGAAGKQGKASVCPALHF